MKGEIPVAKTLNSVYDNKTRSAYWDNIKGFLIILVVLAHCLYQNRNMIGINYIVDGIYFFHMPAFIFVSGYFGKSERSHSFPAIVKLLFAYFVFNSVVGLIYGHSSLTEPVYSYWYLLALAVWRLTAHRIAKFREINLILFAAAVFIGFYPSVDNTFAAARIIGFYPFYMAGYLFPSEKAEELISRRSFRKPLTAALSAAGAVLVGIAVIKICNIDDGAFLMECYEEPIDAFGRTGIYIVAFLAIIAILNFTPSPRSKIPFITAFGRNSLIIFLFHRPFTLIFSDLLGSYKTLLLILAPVCTFLICLIFGNDRVSGIVNKFLDAGAEIFTGSSEGGKKAAGTAAKLSMLAVALCFVGKIVADYYSDIDFSSGDDPKYTVTLTDGKEDVIYPAASSAKLAEFENAFRITFAGDLILLEDQVKRAYSSGSYNFDDVFEYAEPYISSANLAIGVFEGPMAGEDAGYSSSNFDDGKELYLNFPDEFAEAVKNAGFDLVTTATNHVLDKGIPGAERTLDTLDRIGLDHTGSYRTAAEKESSRVKIVEREGIRFAILSYTYGSNYYESSDLAEGGLSYVTSVISGTEGELFETLKASVRNDFEKAKSMDPDLIIVLPHIGTQFSNEADEEQEVWFGIFKEFGADIILGDHPHSVEPVSIDDCGGKKVFTAYCPGNFANIYRENQGDTSALIEVYIDRDSKEIVGGGIVPLYTQSPADGNYRALPVYEIINNYELRNQLSTDDCSRAEEAHYTVAEVMLNARLDVAGISERYLFDENGYLRVKTGGLTLTDEMKASPFYTKLSQAKSVCFIGDSLTEGTKNGGCPWYEPIEEHISADVSNYSKGATTVSYFTERIGEIPVSELYVIAVGTNDVRYRDESTCAMTPESYAEAISGLKGLLLEKNPSAEFVFIAPWYSTDGDKATVLSFGEKTELNREYCSALERFCEGSGDLYINPNGYIEERLNAEPCGNYLIDHIHPNSGRGVIMYSEAVLNCA